MTNTILHALALGFLSATLLSGTGGPSKAIAAPVDAGVLAPGASLEKLAGGFAFTEGPASDAQGNVFFTDQPNNRILKWSVDGQLSTFLEPCGRSNGLSFDASGALWACADEHNELWRINKDGAHEVVASGFEGKLLNGPNDVWVRPQGGVYITDPFYKRDYWQRGPMEQEVQGVFFLPPGARPSELKRVVSDLKQPNGIIGTPDGKVLYIADIGDSKTFAYDVGEDGSLSNKRLFCSLGSDGMTIDSEGNLYLTGQGVTIFDARGQQIEHIEIKEAWTGNVCFGGRDKHSLFITASTSLYRMRMRTHGVGSQ